MSLDRVPNELLAEAGLKLMAQLGRPLRRAPTKGRAMIYQLPDKKTVRLRTSNDHLLVVLANSDDADAARVNVDGTDFLLVVMPERQRTPGPIVAYLVPVKVAVEACRR